MERISPPPAPVKYGRKTVSFFFLNHRRMQKGRTAPSRWGGWPTNVPEKFSLFEQKPYICRQNHLL